MTHPASVAYCCMMSSKPETPHKTTVSAGCFFCSTEVDNAKYRTKIWAQRKTNDLAQKVSSIIQVPANNIPDRYLCRKCLREVEKISKLKEELESCQTHLLEMYNVAVSRSKRCLPTDVVIRGEQPAPYKRAANQSTINSSRKQLDFQNVHPLRPLEARLNSLPDLTLTAHENITRTYENIPDDPPQGTTICQVQVSSLDLWSMTCNMFIRQNIIYLIFI